MTESTALELAPPPRAQLDTFQVAEDAWRLANRIAKTEFVPKGLQGRPEAVLASILKGHELDLPPMTALASIHVINGRPGLSAELQRGLVSRAGHEVWFEEMSATRVTCRGRRADNGNELTVSWTMDDAKRANLAGKDVWRAYPRNMLAARASADVCKFLFPDVIGGLYTIEELEDMPVDDLDTPTLPAGGDEPAPTAATTRKAAAPTARARKKAPARRPAAPGDGPPPPPLPHELDQPAATAPAAEEARDEEAIKRSQHIVIAAKELGIDRADVVYVVTGGRTTSTKDLSKDEAFRVMDALDLIKIGDLRLDLSGLSGHPQLIGVDHDNEVIDAEVLDEFETGDGDPGAGPIDGGEEVGWGGDAWRAWCQQHGVKIVAAIKEARRWAEEHGQPPPLSIDDIAGRTDLAAHLHEWVAQQEAGS